MAISHKLILGLRKSIWVVTVIEKRICPSAFQCTSYPKKEEILSAAFRLTLSFTWTFWIGNWFEGLASGSQRPAAAAKSPPAAAAKRESFVNLSSCFWTASAFLPLFSPAYISFSWRITANRSGRRDRTRRERWQIQPQTRGGANSHGRAQARNRQRARARNRPGANALRSGRYRLAGQQSS